MNQRNKKIIQGHRGAPMRFVENSIDGIIFCAKNDITYVEFDVVLSKCHTPIVLHDPFVNSELFDSEYNDLFIKDLDLIQIESLRFINDDNLKYNYVPTLENLIEELTNYCFENQINTPFLTIEFKHEQTEFYIDDIELYVKSILKVLKKFPEIKYSIQSFSKDIIEECMKSGEINLIGLIEHRNEIENWKSLFDNSSFRGLGIYYKLIDAELLENLKDYSMEISTWTVNDISELNRVLKLGIRNIITDRPLEFKQYLETISD